MEDDHQYIEGEVVPEDEAGQPQGQDDSSLSEKFWQEFSLPPRKFGEILKHVRERIAQQLNRPVSQDEFGDMIGDVNQVTISRWQRGVQVPQREQLLKIVRLAEEYGLKNVTLRRLQQSLELETEEYLALDKRLRRIDELLVREDDDFKAEFYETMISIYHLLRGTRRPGL